MSQAHEQIEGETTMLFGSFDDLEGRAMEQLPGSSFTYRVAVGPQQGRKVFTLREAAAV